MKKGFTLVEVMVVAAIVCIVGAMLLPVLTKSQHKDPIEEKNHEVFSQPMNSLYVYSFTYSNKTYLVSSKGGIIEVRKDE